MHEHLHEHVLFYTKHGFVKEEPHSLGLGGRPVSEGGKQTRLGVRPSKSPGRLTAISSLSLGPPRIYPHNGCITPSSATHGPCQKCSAKETAITSCSAPTGIGLDATEDQYSSSCLKTVP